MYFLDRDLTMNNNVIYENAPIIEALINIQVKLPENISPLDLKKMEFFSNYSYLRKVSKTQIEIKQNNDDENKEISSIDEVYGYTFKNNDDERNICQLNIDCFTISQLSPYVNWEHFRREAKRVWDIYRLNYKPSEIKKIGVRYINRIDIPSPVVEIKDYLKTYPELSSDMPQVLSKFFMQIVTPVEVVGGFCIINQTITDPVVPETVSVILDIEVYKDFSSKTPQNDDEIWGIVENLRLEKNKVFEACITNKVRELIK
jgi:uncharacterized protein (TIGR04255 family)